MPTYRGYEAIRFLRTRHRAGTGKIDVGVVNGVSVLVGAGLATQRVVESILVCARESFSGRRNSGREGDLAHAPDLPAPLPLDLCFSVSPNCRGIKMGKA